MTDLAALVREKLESADRDAAELERLRTENAQLERAISLFVDALPDGFLVTLAEAIATRPDANPEREIARRQASAPQFYGVTRGVGASSGPPAGVLIIDAEPDAQAGPPPVDPGPDRLVRPPGHSTADLPGVDEFPALADVVRPSKPQGIHVPQEPRRVERGKDWSKDPRFNS